MGWGWRAVSDGGFGEHLATPAHRGAPGQAWQVLGSVSNCLGMNGLWFILRQSRTPNSRAKAEEWVSTYSLPVAPAEFYGSVTTVDALIPVKANNFWMSMYEEFSPGLWSWCLKELCKMGVLAQSCPKISTVPKSFCSNSTIFTPIVVSGVQLCDPYPGEIAVYSLFRSILNFFRAEQN